MTERKHAALRGRMAEKGYSQAKMGKLLGINENSMSRKLSGVTPFKADEIKTIVSVLDIPPEKIPTYFFD